MKDINPDYFYTKCYFRCWEYSSQLDICILMTSSVNSNIRKQSGTFKINQIW